MPVGVGFFFLKVKAPKSALGNALLKIRDKQLYRSEYRTFEEYCRERWGFSKSYGKKLVDAAEVIEVLKSDNCHLLPQTESKVLVD